MKIKGFTIHEKLAQLSQIPAVFIKSNTASNNTGEVSELGVTKQSLYNTGSVLNFYGADEMKEISDLCFENSTSKIPVIFMHDVIHGFKTIYPIPLALGGSFDINMIEEVSEMAAREAVLGGVQVTFAPMVDLVRDARWGRVMESTGEDPFLNGVFGKAQIRGYRRGGLLTCVKHFACYGQAEAGREYNTTDMSDNALYNFYLPAYKTCLEENPEMVMTSFNLLNGVPVNGRKDLLIDLLRKKWKYDGVLISDYNGVVEMVNHGYVSSHKECAEIAVNNQIDIEMYSTSYMRCVPELIKEKKIKTKTINALLKRVIALKEKANLFKDRYGKADAEKSKEIWLCDEHRELARKAAEKSIVLLKNNGVLPLSSDDYCLLGDRADDYDVLGSWACIGDKKDLVTVKEGLLNLTSKHSNDNAENVIMCIGETSDMSGEGSSKANLDINPDDVLLARKMKEQGKKVTAVVFAGRPLVLTELEQYCDAILYAWMLGVESGNAIANVLFGKVNPSAKLTMSFPRATGQCPIYYNHFSTGKGERDGNKSQIKNYCSCYQDIEKTPLYPFGYGLSYTTFELSNPVLSDETIKKDEKVVLKVLISNKGKVAGEEVVQLYIHDKYCSVVRPVKELKAFQKVFLKEGESKEISFDISESMLRYYLNPDKYISEVGEFEIMVSCDGLHFISLRLERI